MPGDKRRERALAGLHGIIPGSMIAHAERTRETSAAAGSASESDRFQEEWLGGVVSRAWPCCVATVIVCACILRLHVPCGYAIVASKLSS